MSNLTCHHEGAKTLSNSGFQARSTDWNKLCVPSAQSLVRPGRTLWSSLDRELPCNLTDCWKTVVTVKLPSPCGVSVDAWKNQCKARQLHCDWCAIQCADSQWWSLWWVCHPLACLSVEFSEGAPIECPVTWTYTDWISVWGTNNDLFLTDRMSKLYNHQSASSRQHLRISVTKHLGGSEPVLAPAIPWLGLSHATCLARSTRLVPLCSLPSTTNLARASTLVRPKTWCRHRW